MTTDQRLARRAAAGEQRAFATIFDRYHQRLYRYCMAIVGNPHDAQDALQNTMVKVLRALPGETRQIELKPWLYRVAHNESIELLRRRRGSVELDAELAAPGPGLSEEAGTRERLRLLLSDLDELPERQRGALVMRELAGLDHEQIGTALGTSAPVARQTLYEARLSLREMDEGREMRCDAVTRALSDGDGRVARRRDVRAHLRNCADCRRFREELVTRKHDLAAISPLPAAVAAGLLNGLIGTQAGGSAGAAAALGGGAAKTIGTSAALKGAATVAVVAVIGVGAANRGGLIQLGPTDRNAGPAPTQPTPESTSGVTSERAAKAAVKRLGAGEPVRVEAGDIDDARATGAAAAKPNIPSEKDPAATPVESDSGGATHPSGKGHEKQLPAASAHGQETAAAHKAGGRGASQAKGHPAHPEHPSHPSKPPTPATEKAAPSTPPASGGGAEPQAKGPSSSGSEHTTRGAPSHEATGKP